MSSCPGKNTQENENGELNDSAKFDDITGDQEDVVTCSEDANENIYSIANESSHDDPDFHGDIIDTQELNRNDLVPITEEVEEYDDLITCSEDANENSELNGSAKFDDITEEQENVVTCSEDVDENI